MKVQAFLLHTAPTSIIASSAQHYNFLKVSENIYKVLWEIMMI